MTKASEIARRIEALRKTFPSGRQQDLAEAVGVAVAAVSAWERADEETGYKPKADNFLKLAVVAAAKGLIAEARWFLEQTELDEKTLAVIFGQILKAEPSEMLAALLSKLPAKTRWFEIDETMLGVFNPRDVVVLDETDNDAPDLRPFWNQVVLVDLGRRADRAAGGWDRFFPEGLIFGRLLYESAPSMPSDLSWEVKLAPLVSSAGSREALLLGGWQYRNPLLKLGKLDSTEDWPQAQKEAKEQAPTKIRLKKNFRIRGRVIAWFNMSGENK